jgi:succinate dehydrogenase/fumarate reductase flavoprotein subunit
METVLLDTLTKKLKNAPQSVIERVIGYVDAIMENSKETKSYLITEEQQNILNEQVGLNIKEYTEASKVYSNLKDKHEL